MELCNIKSEACNISATLGEYLYRLKKEIMAKKYSDKAQEKVHETMKEYKEGKLKSGSGKKVKSKKQAVAIGLSKARKSGAKVPSKK